MSRRLATVGDEFLSTTAMVLRGSIDLSTARNTAREAFTS